MRDLPIQTILLRAALTCLVILIAMGIDNLIFHIADASKGAALTVATIGFIALVAGIITTIWFNEY